MRNLLRVFVIMTVIASCRYVLFMFSLFVCSVWSYILSEGHSVSYVCLALMTDKLIVFILTIVQIQRNCQSCPFVVQVSLLAVCKALTLKDLQHLVWALRPSRYCSKQLSNFGYPEKDNEVQMSYKCEYFDLL